MDRSNTTWYGVHHVSHGTLTLQSHTAAHFHGCGLLTLKQRVFKYNDTKGWVVNAIACLCMIASGTALPLMDVVFGAYVNVFNDFVAGSLSPAGYRKQVAHYAYVLDTTLPNTVFDR